MGLFSELKYRTGRDGVRYLTIIPDTENMVAAFLVLNVERRNRHLCNTCKVPAHLVMDCCVDMGVDPEVGVYCLDARRMIDW